MRFRARPDFSRERSLRESEVPHITHLLNYDDNQDYYDHHSYNYDNDYYSSTSSTSTISCEVSKIERGKGERERERGNPH